MVAVSSIKAIRYGDQRNLTGHILERTDKDVGPRGRPEAHSSGSAKAPGSRNPAAGKRHGGDSRPPAPSTPGVADGWGVRRSPRVAGKATGSTGASFQEADFGSTQGRIF